MIDFGDIMRIGWAITGAGHLLNESVDALEELAENNEITVFLSNASEEVLKMYGLYERVEAFKSEIQLSNHRQALLRQV